MEKEKRRALIASARGNLRESDMREFMKLLDGDYRDDEAALRGFIWGCIEGEEHNCL